MSSYTQINRTDSCFSILHQRNSEWKHSFLHFFFADLLASILHPERSKRVWSTTCHGYATHYGGLWRRAKGGTLTSSSLQELIRFILKYIYLQQMISIQFAVPSQQLQIINYPKEDLILIIQHQCCKEKDAV